MNRTPEDEYAEAYRRGYERARSGGEPTQQLGFLAGAFGESTYDEAPAADDRTDPTERTERRTRATRRTRTDRLERTERRTRATRRTRLRRSDRTERREQTAAGADLEDDWLAAERRRRRIRVAALAGAALLLVVGAYGVGRLLADDGVTTSAGGGTPDTAEAPRAAQAYEGAVRAVPLARASATCQSGSSVDAAGNPVTYEPAKVHDADLSTAWRCDGDGAGQALTVDLAEETEVAELGLVPGYAKTDPASGVDRYAENNRITRVRWRFDDGTTFVQRMSANPHDRSMRVLRIPPTETSQVVLEILGSRPGARDTVAVSEIRVASPAA